MPAAVTPVGAENDERVVAQAKFFDLPQNPADVVVHSRHPR